MQHKFLPKKLDIITISIRNFALIILELDKCPLDKCPTSGIVPKFDPESKDPALSKVLSGGVRSLIKWCPKFYTVVSEV